MITRQDVDASIAALGAEQHGVVHGSQLRRLGMSASAVRHRVNRGVLVRLKRDIYRVRDHPPTWHARLQALLLDAGPDAVVSHRSAARLHGFWRYRHDAAVEVTTRECHDHLVTLGRLHRSSWMPNEHRALVAGFPTTTVARTCFDLMGDPDPGLRRSPVGSDIHARNMLRVVNDALARHGMTLAQFAAVQAALSKRGRSGSRLARETLGYLEPGYVPTESEGEDLFVELVALYDMPPPERQVQLSGDRGWVGRVDFLYPECRLVIEIDGATHAGPLDRMRDEARDAELRALGYDVWRIPYRQLLLRPHAVMRDLRQRLTAR
jgi:hypothetical protein